MPAPGGLTASHAKIPSGTAVSGEVDLRGRTLFAITTPSTFEGTSITLQCAEKPTAEGGVYTDIYYLSTLAATLVTITSVAASRTIVIDSAILPQGIGNCMLKVTITVGGNVAADRDLTLHCRPF